MKHLLTIGVVLTASQCLPATPGEDRSKAAEDAGEAAESTPDAGRDAAATDTGAPTAPERGLWLEPGPEPFDVPTERLALPALGVTILVPVGTRANKTPNGVEVRLGEGKNFWIEVTDAATDLAATRDRLRGEIAPLDARFQDAVVWNEGERWLFEYAGDFGCSNPLDARHDRRDVELMIASCRTIEAANQ